MSRVHIREWQGFVGAVRDGAFGPKTLEASYAAAKGADTMPPGDLYTEQPFRVPELDFFHQRWRDVVNPTLVRFVDELAARSRFAFGVYESLRTKERQEAYVRQGKSWTLNSRHLTGHAVDLVWLEEGKPGHWDWSNSEQYEHLAELGKQVADECGFDIRNLGLDIGKDWYHFEIPR